MGGIESTARRVIETARRSRLSLILLSPSLGSQFEAPDVLVRPYVDLGWLLPQARALIHHGGIGTVAEAIRAATPQLILPGRFDQPDNAVRIAQLGLGGAILRDAFSDEELDQTLERILASTHVAMQVATASSLAARGDAVERAADLLGRLASDPR